MPPVLLLLLASVGIAAVAGGKRKRSKLDMAQSEGPEKLRPRRVKLKGVRYLPQNELLQMFGENTEQEYPAPYRYQDARLIGQVLLDAASMTSPKLAPYFAELVRRWRAIDSAALPNWRKTYAIVYTVFVPAFASNMLWHWYRKPSRSKLKEDRFNALAAWMAMFLATPVTSTASPGIEVYGGNTSLLPGWGAYLDPATQLRRGNLTQPEIRRVLYDVFGYMRVWHHTHPGYGGGEGIDELAASAAARMGELNNIYPQSDPTQFVIEGNMKAADEIIWLANAHAQGSISVDFDEGSAIAALVVRTIATVVSAVVPFVGPAIGAALQTATNALGAMARIVASGEMSYAQFQAAAGAGVTLMLNQTGIRIEGLDDAIAQLEGLG